MKRFSLLVSISYLALSAPALAKAVPADEPANVAQSDDQSANAKPKAFTTGVAKGRDMFDTAISASTLDDTDIQKISAVSVAEIIGNIPGIRSEGSGTDGFSAISIRGLPLAADGAKFLQLQEDGLPVLEFGDIHFGSSDTFLRGPEPVADPDDPWWLRIDVRIQRAGWRRQLPVQDRRSRRRFAHGDRRSRS